MEGGKHIERFTLDDEIARMPAAEADAGRRTETLVTLDRLRVMLVTLRAGEVLREHAAPGPITIHALRGRFDLRVEGEECEIGPGELVAIDTRVGHTVRALEDGAFLWTIGWPTRMPGEPRIDV